MKAIQIATAEGQSIFVEINPDVRFETPTKPSEDAGAAEGVVEPEALLAKLDEIGDTISSTCKSLHAKIISGLKEHFPNEMTIEFGVTLGGEAGIPFVVNGSAEATFTVSTTWRFDAIHKNSP